METGRDWPLQGGVRPTLFIIGGSRFVILSIWVVQFVCCTNIKHDPTPLFWLAELKKKGNSMFNFHVFILKVRIGLCWSQWKLTLNCPAEVHLIDQMNRNDFAKIWIMLEKQWMCHFGFGIHRYSLYDARVDTALISSSGAQWLA